MKTISQIVSIALLALLIGCATPNPNAGQVTVTTNPSTGASTTNVAPPFLPNASVTSAVNTISQLNSATAPLNPYSGIISLALGATTLVAGGIAAWKNNQANGLTTQLASVIQGVETATAAPTVTAASVKGAIQARATAAGVQPALDATVQKLTG